MTQPDLGSALAGLILPRPELPTYSSNPGEYDPLSAMFQMLMSSNVMLPEIQRNLHHPKNGTPLISVPPPPPIPVANPARGNMVG